MRTEIVIVRQRVCLVAWVVLFSLFTVSLIAQETGGTISGTLKDSSGAVVAGARVTMTNKATGRVNIAITGADGTYAVRQLPPGRYSVRFDMSGFTPVEVADAELLLGKTIRVDATLQVAPVEQAVTVIESAPLVDLSSTIVGHNVTSEEIIGLPKARSFQGLLATSPRVTSGVDQFGNIVGIEGGFQVNGASSAENQFNIDGVSTTSLVNGRSRQNAVFEFVQEVQVKTAGIEAEYGGAMGGVLSAVTKSGGNSFHGDLHYYFAGSGISAGPVLRLQIDPNDSSEKRIGYIQDDKQSDKRHEFGGSLGGYFVKDKLWFFTGVSPQWRRRENNYLFNSGTEPDTIKQKSLTQNLFARVDFAPTQRVRTYFTWLYTPATSTGRLPAYNGFAPQVVTSSRASNQINKQVGTFQPQSSYTGQVDITLSNRMLLTVKGGRFWDNYKDTGIPGISAVEYRTPTSSLGALEANVPPAQRGGTLFGNTPRLQNVFYDLVTRTFVQADFGVFGNLWGDHDVKLGIGTMKNVNKVNNSYPGGGYVLVFWNSTLQTGPLCSVAANRDAGLCRGTYGYYEVNDFGTRGTSGANLSNIYVQDKWKIHPRLTLSLGVRFEKEAVPSFRRDIRDIAFDFGYSDKVAPRLGFAYDYFGDGRMKVAFSWGRFYDWVKYELARGTFGGDVWRIYYRSLDTPDAFSLSGTNRPGRDIWNPAVSNSFRDRRVPGFDTVAPGIKPMSTDLLNAGIEYELAPNLLFSAYYVNNRLRRTIEDLGALDEHGDEVYYYANPGEGVAKITPPSGATTRPIPTPKPVRTYNAMELTLTRRMSNGWFGSASYVLSRLYGNYSGIAASEEVRPPTTGVSAAAAQQQGGSITRQGGNANRAWDIDELLFDSHGKLDPKGLLPTDRTHQFKFYGSKQFSWGTEIGAFFSVASGTPLTTYVNTVNQTEVFVEGRGDMGRTPILSQTDLMLAHSFDITEGKRIRVEWNFINLFNQKTARHKFNWLNRGAGTPRSSSAINLANTDLFQGYDYRAMIANTVDGRNPNLGALDPRYGKDDIWNPGFQSRFGVKFTF